MLKILLFAILKQIFSCLVRTLLYRQQQHQCSILLWAREEVEGEREIEGGRREISRQHSLSLHTHCLGLLISLSFSLSKFYYTTSLICVLQ